MEATHTQKKVKRTSTENTNGITRQNRATEKKTRQTQQNIQIYTEHRYTCQTHRGTHTERHRQDVINKTRPEKRGDAKKIKWPLRRTQNM